jgi:hypothetical protein
MATLKATVKSKLKTGMYIVYIRVVHNRQSSFIRTSWLVNDKGIKGKDKARLDRRDDLVCVSRKKEKITEAHHSQPEFMLWLSWLL